MEQKFKKYESIVNDNNQRTIDYYKELGYTASSILWYSTEKTHGTHFSAISNGISVVYAQRGGIIQDSFFNYQANVSKIHNKILALAKETGQDIQIEFEYYGKGIINVKAIPYRNDDEKDFIAYDILLLDSNTFMSYPDNFMLFDKFDITRPEILGVGTFDEMIKLDNDQKSHLAKSNGVDTYAEGMVLKPCIDIRLNTEQQERVILKRVSKRFAENRPVKNVKTVQTLDNNITELIESKITDVRLGKVAGKFGILPSEKNKFGLLINEMGKDICDEILTDTLETVDINLVKKQLSTIVKSFFQ